ncbi:MAG: V-type ATP synthase subunit D [archaeon]|nr:V-type ATP synthase subunit D [archaeon]
MSVSFGAKALPTKLELIRVKRSLRVAEAVHKILEDKREILLRRLEELIGEAAKAREEIWQPLNDAYRALFNAYLRLGPVKLESIAMTTPTQVETDIDMRMILDVKVHSLRIKMVEKGLTYGFMDTGFNLDEATKTMKDALPYIFKAAETENAVFSLARELEETQRLINALEYLVIPTYQENVKYITSSLDEREREDFARLKHVKRILERSRAGEIIG